MSYCRQVTSSLVRPAIVPAILIFAFSACRVPIDFQKGKPFVYKTTVKVEGNMKPDDKQDLTLRLENQLDDSLQTKTITAFDWPWKGHIIYKKLSHPPVYDSLNLSRSISFMHALLVANGYYEPQISDTVIYRSLIREKKLKKGRIKGKA